MLIASQSTASLPAAASGGSVSRSSRPAAAVALLAVLFAGCPAAPPPPPPAPTPAATTKTSATRPAATGTRVASAAGFQLQVDQPVAASTCFVSLAKVSDRYNYLRLSTNQGEAAETFPSVLMFAQIAAGERTALDGQQVLAYVYFQRSPADPVWQTTPGQLVTLRITKSDGDSISGDVVSGSLVNLATGDQKALAGRFSGVWQ